MRFWGFILLCFGISGFCVLTTITGSFTTFQALILTVSLFESIAAMIFGFAFLIGPKIKYRTIDDYYICHYVGWKNRLIIDGEEEDSSLMGKCYGTLPDGREVESGGLFGITFKVTDPQTGRTRRL